MDGVAKPSHSDDEGLDADPPLPRRVTMLHVTPHTAYDFSLIKVNNLTPLLKDTTFGIYY
jgi:hypothetical protein